MPTICSAIRKGDNTVGTSTNLTAYCGSGIREREGHGEQEILGTSITCSAIGRSRIRKASATQSTVCGTGRSRICTNGQTEPRSSMTCRSKHTCRQQPQAEAPAGLFFEAAILCPLEEWCENAARQWRRSSAHAATWSGAVALFVAERRHSTVVARKDQPSSVTKDETKATQTCLSLCGGGGCGCGGCVGGCVGGCGGGCGGGSDGVLMRCVWPYPITVAPNWGGRTPASQTPGVPATPSLNVQMDGGRKMLQNCSKLPLIAATMPTIYCERKCPPPPAMN